MVDPKESSEVPNSATPADGLDRAESVKPTRDPELEALLKSRSSDDDEGVPAARTRTKRSRNSKGARTGTSLDRKSKKSKTPIVAGALAAVLLLGGGGTALWLTLAPGESQIDPDRNRGRTQDAGTKQADPEDEADAPFNADSGSGVFPIALDDWQQGPGTEGLGPEGRTALLETLTGSDLSISASTLPAEAAGFTSDDLNALNADGTLNGYYSYWTQESFTADAGQIVEKFLNPRFGNWEIYQGKGLDPNGIDAAKLFPSTFTDDLLKNGGPVVNWLPIYADWDNDSYGRGDLSATGARWYGEVVSSTSEFVYNEDSSQYTVNFNADVKFTAYKSNGEKVSEKGKLSLEFVANPGGERGSGGKVLVNKSNLTIGG